MSCSDAVPLELNCREPRFKMPKDGFKRRGKVKYKMSVWWYNRATDVLAENPNGRSKLGTFVLQYLATCHCFALQSCVCDVFSFMHHKTGPTNIWAHVYIHFTSIYCAKYAFGFDLSLMSSLKMSVVACLFAPGYLLNVIFTDLYVFYQ